MSSVSDVIKRVTKTYGAGIASMGVEVKDVSRVMTGIFPLDLATGGGFPKGRVTEIFGPESSNKTNILLKTIATYQRLHPDELCAFIDVEHSFDPAWASRLGVDTEKLVFFQPHYAEMAVDIVEDILSNVPEITFIGLDSIAAMATANEIENSAEKVAVGGNSIPVNRMMKKVVMAQTRAAAEGRYPTLVCINQIRFKVGVMFGNPETTPGGKAVPFYSAMRIRCYGKDVLDKNISKSVPAYKETKVVLKKWKVPVTSVNAEFNMCMIDSETTTAGEVPAWKTIFNYCVDYGMLVKNGQNWVLGDHTFKTQKEVKDFIDNDPDLYIALISEIISLSVQKHSTELGIKN
jgi:recombination protein RecA